MPSPAPVPPTSTRRLLAGLAAGAALTAVLPAAAPAAVMRSAITTPAPDTVLEGDLRGPGSTMPTVDVRGTSDGRAGDRVDVRCLRWDGTNPYLGSVDGGDDVPVGDDGGFAATVRVADGPCRLHAVPADASSQVDRTPFSGPDLLVGSTRLDSYRDHPGDWSIQRVHRGATTALGSFGGCAIAALVPLSGPERGPAATGFWCSAGYGGTRNQHGLRAHVVVDGVEAYVGSDAHHDVPGRPTMTMERTVDAATGELSVVETSDVVACVADGDVSCARHTPTGVRLARRTVVDHGGRLVRTTDAWTSTDGAPHALDLLEYHAGSWSAALRIPWWAGSEAAPAAGSPIPPAPAGPVTVVLEPRPDDPRHGRGAVTWDGTPDGGLAGGDGDVFLRFVRPVPAGGTFTLRRAHVVGTTAEEVADLVREARADWEPTGDGSPGPGAPPAQDPPPRDDPSADPPPRESTPQGPPPAASARGPRGAATRTRPARLTVGVRPGRDRRAPYRFAVGGRLVLPAGAPAAACRGVRITLRVAATRGSRRRTLLTRTVRTTARCTWRTTLRVPERRVGRAGGRLTLTATSAATSRLTARQAPRSVLRVG